jgi:hypothetical protein
VVRLRQPAGLSVPAVYAFTLLLLAHGAMLAAQIADRIYFLGAQLAEFKAEIAVMLVFLLAAACTDEESWPG